MGNGMQSGQPDKKLTKKKHISSINGIDFFNESIDAIIKYHQKAKKQFALLWVKLNNIDSLVNEHGVEIKDKVIENFSLRIKQFIKPQDIFAKISEYESVILLQDIPNYLYSIQKAQSITNYFKQRIELDNHFITLDCKVIINCFPEDDSENLMISVKERHVAKADEVDCHFYNDELQTQYIELLTLEERFIDDLNENKLYLEYQPIVHLFTNQITGFEALLRWCDDEKGIIPPELFIPIAKRRNLCEKINTYVLSNAINDFHEVIENCDYPFKVSINIFREVSSLIEHAKLLSSILLKNNDVSPYFKLEVEMTESDLLASEKESIKELHHAMNELKKLNLSIAIDNFGIRNLPIQQLTHYPFDVIKIDPSYSMRLNKPQNPSNEIIGQLIENAKALSFDLVAKGVETKQQAELLKKMGCPKAQGFYFHPPMSVSKALDVIKQNTYNK
jgi:EAL domain-containing protein (putative c-di-GMP-specific phosphodiesterase class I)/GGDEF domain-containing protein